MTVPEPDIAHLASRTRLWPEAKAKPPAAPGALPTEASRPWRPGPPAAPPPGASVRQRARVRCLEGDPRCRLIHGSRASPLVSGDSLARSPPPRPPSFTCPVGAGLSGPLFREAMLFSGPVMRGPRCSLRSPMAAGADAAPCAAQAVSCPKGGSAVALSVQAFGCGRPKAGTAVADAGII